jgi:hypothetical protein
LEEPARLLDLGALIEDAEAGTFATEDNILRYSEVRRQANS